MQNFKFKKVKAVRIPGLNTHLVRSPLRFPGGPVGKESDCNAGDLGSIPGLGRSSGEGNGYPLQYSWGFLVAQLVNNPPAMWETWVPSLSQEDPLEKGMATQLQYPGLENPMDSMGS